MAGYIGNKSSVVSSGAERKFKFTITETTTTLSNLAYTRDLVHVFHNGVRLVDGTDYTATNGTSITLTNAAENGDEVVVISYASFQPSDTVSASLGGFFEGNVTINADLTVSGNTDINGGTIDGTVIGGSTPAAISGTTGTFSGNLTVDTNTLFVDSANNRVGVGTTSPASLLDIANPSGFSNRVIHVTGDINPTGYDASTSGARVGFTYGTAEVAGIRSGVTNGTGGAETSRLVFSTANSGVLSEKLRIEANGAVGIGTSSPSARLSIKQINNSTLGGLQVIRSDTTAHGVMYMGGDDALYVQNQANGAMVFYANLAERMRIDSAGRVTMPYQPAFSARREAAGVAVQTSGVITWNVVQVNIGSHYNSSTGVFTAPVSGVYVFNFFGIVGNSGSGGISDVSLQVNGVSIASTHTNHDQAWDNASFSARVALAANDQVQVAITYSANNSGLYVNGSGAGSYNTFSGHLIG